MSDKFCVDCKHCTVMFDRDRNCISPEIPKDLVTGRRYSLTCRDARYDNGFCGYEGKWFESKQEGNTNENHNRG